MNRKSIIFIVSILAIYLGVTFYNRYKEHMENEKKESKAEATTGEVEDVYGVFELEGWDNDFIPDVMVEMGEKVQYRFGKNTEETEFGELELIVNSAELLDKLKEEDMDNGSLLKRIKLCVSKDLLIRFEEELRYLYVNFTIKNIGDEDRTFDFQSLGWANSEKFGKKGGCQISFDGAKLIVDGEAVTIENKDFVGMDMKLKAGSEYEMECIAIVEPGMVQDMYLVTNDRDDNYPNDQVAVRLDIELNESIECDPTDGVVSEFQKRDLKQLRINAGYTSYSYFEEQEEGYYFTDNHFYEFGSIVGEEWEQAPGEIISGTKMTVLEAELVEERKNLPDRFRHSKYIEGMLEVYKKQLPYDEDEYRYVYLKARYKQLGNLRAITMLSDCLWLYNRDENDNLWVFGCADDYYIASSTNDSQTTEYQQIVMEQGEEIIVEAVYIVVPDTVYDLYIYNYNNGLISRGNTSDDKLYGAISLDIKEYEQGGIK